MTLLMVFFGLGIAFGLLFRIVGFAVLMIVSLFGFVAFSQGAVITGSLLLDVIILGLTVQIGYLCAITARIILAHRRRMRDGRTQCTDETGEPWRER